MGPFYIKLFYFRTKHTISTFIGEIHQKWKKCRGCKG